MNRQTVLFAVILFVGIFILGLVWNPPSVGQAPLGPAGRQAFEAQAGKAGKYQVAIGSLGAGNVVVILCDTETGQLWEKMDHPNTAQVRWQPVSSPFAKQK